MVQGIFKEISFRSNEDMTEKSGKLFSKLYNINNFHTKCYIHNAHTLLKHDIRTSLSPEPSGHKSCLTEHSVAPDWANDVVDDWVGPFDESVAPFFPRLWLDVSLVSYVIFLAKIIENIVNEEVEELFKTIITVKTKANGNP